MGEALAGKLDLPVLLPHAGLSWGPLCLELLAVVRVTSLTTSQRSIRPRNRATQSSIRAICSYGFAGDRPAARRDRRGSRPRDAPWSDPLHRGTTGPPLPCARAWDCPAAARTSASRTPAWHNSAARRIAADRPLPAYPRADAPGEDVAAEKKRMTGLLHVDLRPGEGLPAASTTATVTSAFRHCSILASAPASSSASLGSAANRPLGIARAATTAPK